MRRLVRNAHPTLYHVDRALALIEKLLEWLVALLVALQVAILAIKLIDRHFYDIPIAAPDEYAKMALVWLTFIGFALAVRTGVNIKVDLIEPRLPPRVKHWLELAFDALLVILSGWIAFKGWRFVEIALDKIILGTDVPEAVPDAALLAATILIIAFAARRLVARLRGEPIAQPQDHVASPD
jgi:TRAP-type transport system small permease protein